ncbi:MAG: Cys-tRNA(Pro) deacylase [Candidatus Limivicinus sp.]|nr:Cys-tRNA(Pro) deacylase [Candidatus Limivicinus sp.]
MAEQKTNVMRILGQKKIKYTAHEYPHGEDAVDGVTVARMTGRDPACVFKTLVTRGASKGIYVFVIPVAEELDLKKAAKAVGEKSIAMVHVSEINALTGYVRGGCSPIGMKKQFKTVYHSSILSQDTVLVSAGKIGQQVELSPADLIGLTRGDTANIVTEV